LSGGNAAIGPRLRTCVSAVRKVRREITAAENRVIIRVPHEIVGIEPAHAVQGEQQVTEVAVPRAIGCAADEGNAEGAVRRIVAAAGVQTKHATRIDPAGGRGKRRYAQRSGAGKVKGQGRVRTPRIDEAVSGQQVYPDLHRVGVDLGERDNANIGRLRSFAEAERVEGPRHGDCRREADGRGNRYGDKRLHFVRGFHVEFFLE